MYLKNISWHYGILKIKILKIVHLWMNKLLLEWDRTQHQFCSHFLFLDKSSQKPWERNKKKFVTKSSLNYLNSFQVITPKSCTDLLSKLIPTMPVGNSIRLSFNFVPLQTIWFVKSSVTQPAVGILHYHLFVWSPRDFFTNKKYALYCFRVGGWWLPLTREKNDYNKEVVTESQQDLTTG